MALEDRSDRELCMLFWLLNQHATKLRNAQEEADPIEGLAVIVEAELLRRAVPLPQTRPEILD